MQESKLFIHVFLCLVLCLSLRTLSGEACVLIMVKGAGTKEQPSISANVFSIDLATFGALPLRTFSQKPLQIWPFPSESAGFARIAPLSPKPGAFFPRVSGAQYTRKMASRGWCIGFTKKANRFGRTDLRAVSLDSRAHSPPSQVFWGSGWV